MVQVHSYQMAAIVVRPDTSVLSVGAEIAVEMHHVGIDRAPGPIKNDGRIPMRCHGIGAGRKRNLYSIPFFATVRRDPHSIPADRETVDAIDRVAIAGGDNDVVGIGRIDRDAHLRVVPGKLRHVDIRARRPREPGHGDDHGVTDGKCRIITQLTDDSLDGRRSGDGRRCLDIDPFAIIE